MKRLLLLAALIVSACAVGHADIVTPPAGSNTQVQFNKQGRFGADSDLTYSTTTHVLSVSSMSVVFMNGTTVTVNKLAFSDGTSQTTAASLSSLNASNLTSGTVPNARLDSSSVTLQGPVVSSITQNSMFGTPTLTGTNFSGIPDSALTSNVNLLNASQAVSGVKTHSSSFTVNGAGGEKVLYGLTVGTITITATSATSLSVGGGITAGTGSVGIVDTTGKIPALSSTYLASLSGASLTGIANSSLDNSSVTLQGNTFNGASQLVQMNSSTQLPAVSGANLTSLTAANMSAGTLAVGVLISTIPNNTPFGGGTARAFLYVNTSTQVAETAAATNGQVLIGSTGANPVAAALTGTSNQVVVTNAAGSITLSTPQSIGTGSSPQFSALGIGVAAGQAPQLLTVTSNGASNTSNSVTGDINCNATVISTYTQVGLRARSTTGNSSGGTLGTIVGLNGEGNGSAVNGFPNLIPTSIGVVGISRTLDPATGVSTTTLAIGVAGVIVSSGTSTHAGRITTAYSLYTSSNVFQAIGEKSSSNIGTHWGLYMEQPLTSATGGSIYTSRGNIMFNGDNIATSSVTIQGGGLVVGTNSSVAPVSQIMRGSAALDFGATTAGTCDDLTVTVTGAADADPVFPGIPNALASTDATTTFDEFVSATNTVTVRRCCTALVGACSNPASATVNVVVFH